MIAFGEFINILQRGNASINRIQDNLEQRQEVSDTEKAVEIVHPGLIEFKGLTFRYPEGSADSLKDLTLQSAAGKHWASSVAQEAAKAPCSSSC